MPTLTSPVATASSILRWRSAFSFKRRAFSCRAWAFSSRQDYKDNADQKAQVVAEEAVKKETVK